MSAVDLLYFRSKSTIYQAIATVKNDDNKDEIYKFYKLHTLLKDYFKINTNSSYKLQVDQHNQFYQYFAINGILQQNLYLNQPVLGTDGAHSKHPRYSGVYLAIVGVNGKFS
jgi:hypothetical protein